MKFLAEIFLRIVYFFWRRHERAVLGREFIVVRCDGGEGSITYGESMEILLLPNGMTAAFDENDEQEPALKKSWLGIYLDWLDDHDVDPRTVTITMPDGSKVKPYATEDGWNWEWNGYRPKSQPKHS
jgi:hypothetical protein